MPSGQLYGRLYSISQSSIGSYRLYVKGFVDGKPMNKMLVDGGASINLMSYTTFRKLGKGPGDLIETNMMLKDFGGNASKT